jgi:phenylacetate-CoA ligase
MLTLGEKLYLAFPAFRNIAATAKGVMLKRERYGKYYREALIEIQNRDRWTYEQIVDYQSRRLREIIDIAVHHVPYYSELFRKLGLSARDIQSADDLQKLPILEKATLREDPLRFVDERLKPHELLEFTTTGTTGTPIRVFMTSRVQQQHYAFLEGRCRHVVGLRHGQNPYVMFGVRHVVALERTKPPFWCYNYAGKQLYMSVYHLAPKYLADYCHELKRRPYKALMGYPSAMSRIARYILSHGIDDIRIPIAITNGETLQAEQREAIERAFGCRVFDQYGCAELSVFSAERSCGRMHVSSDYGVTEIVDDFGNAVPDGKLGHLVCTSLVNDAQILIRSRVGDMASWDQNFCECESPLPVFKSVDGRSTDAMILPDGRQVFRVSTIGEDIRSIMEYQIVQEDVGSFTIYAVTSNEFSESDREQLLRNLSAHVGRASIRIELVTSLKRGPGGKFAFIVSKVPREKFALSNLT